MSAKLKQIIPMKGPEKLSPEVIRDICENRSIKDACRVLSKKHGISTDRVRNLWSIYYGGTTLEDYKTGLKKPLPTEAIPQKDINKRVIKTERAIYEVKEPKTLIAATRKDVGSRAAAQRKIPVRISDKLRNLSDRSQDLDLDNVADMDDADAEIMAGEVSAGNNSSELLSAIEQLIAHNQNVSDRTLNTLERALEAANKRRNKYASDTDYSTTTDIDETEDEDDSTVINRATASRQRDQGRHTVRRQHAKELLESTDGPEEYAEFYNSDHYPMGTCEDTPIRLPRSNQLGTSVRQGPPGPSSRAQPVYRTVRDRDVIDPDEEQGDYSQTGRYEQTIPPAQHYTSQGRVQQSYAHNNPQQYPGPIQGVGVHSGSRAGPGEVVQGHPWLKPRF